MALASAVPVFLTGLAAALGYAYAVYPIREHMGNVARIESLGPLISDDETVRRGLLEVYYEDSGLDVDSFEQVAWTVPSVMTPFVGYAPAPGRHSNAYITPRQFRGRKELATPKPTGVTRIFLTGASTAFSVGASSDDRTIGGYLQSVLDRRAADDGRRYEVFTFAAPAWSSTHERIAIENRISDFEPDLVIELTGTADCLYGQAGRNVLWGRAFIDNYYWRLVNIALGRGRLRQMKDVQDASRGSVPASTVAARLRKNVQLGAMALSLVDARLHVFLQPDLFTTAKALTPRERAFFSPSDRVKPDYYRECSRKIGELLGSSGIPANASFTNLHPVFDETPQTEEIFLDSFHFGDRGNLIIAQAMVDAIL